LEGGWLPPQFPRGVFFPPSGGWGPVPQRRARERRRAAGGMAEVSQRAEAQAALLGGAGGGCAAAPVDFVGVPQGGSPGSSSQAGGASGSASAGSSGERPRCGEAGGDEGPDTAAAGRGAGSASATAAAARGALALPRTVPSSFLLAGQRFEGTQSAGSEEAWRVSVQLQEVDLARGYVCGSMQAYGFRSSSAQSASVLTFWEGDVIDEANSGFLTRRWGASDEDDLDHWSRFRPLRGVAGPGGAPWGADGRMRKLARGSLSGGGGRAGAGLGMGPGPEAPPAAAAAVGTTAAAPAAAASGAPGGAGADGGVASLPAHSATHIFMRWKEKFFVNVGPECGLTIAGFYYVCLDRRTGEIEGFYFDPNSSPYQKLEMRPQRQSPGGFAFESYQFL